MFHSKRKKSRNEVNNNNNNSNAPLPKYFVTITYSLVTSDEQQSDWYWLRYLTIQTLRKIVIKRKSKHNNDDYLINNAVLHVLLLRLSSCK